MPKKKRIIKKSNLLTKLKTITKKEKKIENIEKRQLKELEQLKKLEEQIKKQTAPHPLKKITYRDVSKASIGALIGTVAHFAFVKGGEIAESITVTRATFILILSFVIGCVFIYLTGFKKVKVNFVGIFPVRVTVIYITSLLMVLLVLFIFGLTDFSSFTTVYKQVAVISVLAILGASTADLIGKGESVES